MPGISGRFWWCKWYIDDANIAMFHFARPTARTLRQQYFISALASCRLVKYCVTLFHHLFSASPRAQPRLKLNNEVADILCGHIFCGRWWCRWNVLLQIFADSSLNITGNEAVVVLTFSINIAMGAWRWRRFQLSCGRIYGKWPAK